MIGVFVLCILILFNSTAFAQVFSVSQDRIFVGTYNMVPVTVSFKQGLQHDYDLQSGGTIMVLYSHYNNGLKYNYPNGLFSWHVYPIYFRLYENYSMIRNFTSFSWFPSIYPPGTEPWGGRNNTQVTLYLPGNVHGGLIRSQYYSGATLPNVYYYNLGYGIY